MCPVCKTTLDQSDSPVAQRMQARSSAAGSRPATRSSEIKRRARRRSSARAMLAAPAEARLRPARVAAADRRDRSSPRRSSRAPPGAGAGRAAPADGRSPANGRAARPGARAARRRGARPLRWLERIPRRLPRRDRLGDHAVRAAARARATCRRCRRSRRTGSASGGRRGASSLASCRSSPGSRSCSSRSAPARRRSAASIGAQRADADRRLRARRLRAGLHRACCRGRSASSRPACSGRAHARLERSCSARAFAVCAAPCIGGVLGADPRAGGRRRHGRLRRSLLLFVYSAGSASRSCSPGSPSRARWRAFRWLRDHYGRSAGRQRRRRWSRSGCCSSSTATGGCASRSTARCEPVGLGDV